MKLSPLDLRKQQFAKTFRGYDPDEVKAYLGEVARQWDEVLDELHQADSRLRELEHKLKHYERVELALQEALESARETGRRAESAAEQKAKLIIEKAELDALRYKQDAEQERYGLRQDLVKLTNIQRRATAQLRAFLMTELEMLAQFQGSDPIGFIKLVPAGVDPSALPPAPQRRLGTGDDADEPYAPAAAAPAVPPAEPEPSEEQAESEEALRAAVAEPARAPIERAPTERAPIERAPIERVSEPVAEAPAPTPEPVTPEPVAPEPVAPEPYTPETVEPEPVAPAPVAPESFAAASYPAEPYAPEPAAPEAYTSEPYTPAPAAPEPAEAEAEPASGFDFEAWFNSEDNRAELPPLPSTAPPADVSAPGPAAPVDDEAPDPSPPRPLHEVLADALRRPDESAAPVPPISPGVSTGASVWERFRNAEGAGEGAVPDAIADSPFFRQAPPPPDPGPAPGSDAAQGWSLRSLVTGERDAEPPAASEDEREKIRRLLEGLD